MEPSKNGPIVKGWALFFHSVADIRTYKHINKQDHTARGLTH